MKCPKCEANHKRSQGMRCGCGYQFVFDPKVDKIADGKFHAAIRRVSSADTRYFTVNQLDAVIRHGRAKSAWPSGITALVSLMMLAASFLWETSNGILLFIFVVFGVSLLVWLARLLYKPTHLDVPTLLQRWHRRNGPIEKLITEPKLHQPPPEWKEPDIYDYGVERILIVERDILVDLLVRNGFHAEQRALVFAASGYPSYIESRARKIFQESPSTPIFLLHDSTPDGLRLKEQVASKYGLDGIRLIDLGMFPDDWKRHGASGKLGLRHDGYQAPADFLLYAGMSGMTAAAFVAAVPFAELPPEQRPGDSGGPDSSDGSGYG